MKRFTHTKNNNEYELKDRITLRTVICSKSLENIGDGLNKGWEQIKQNNEKIRNYRQQIQIMEEQIQIMEEQNQKWYDMIDKVFIG